MNLHRDMQNAVNEFSRVIELSESILDKKFETEASVEEMAALAKRFDVNAIKSFKLNYLITGKEDIIGAYTLVASIAAKVVKFLINGNEETVNINENFDVVLLTEDMARNNYEELQEMDIEIFDDEKRVDVGEIAAQYLSLCIFM